ncbi:hypothetical protein J1N35_005116 [Gossypium stocksii]|uniref:Uncharacterized protein n=1 Tax=Gossypium stocksii TaxID=47602 RepID=A0A9D4AIY7_9ROSI|nr:hypothetical protein J1N35_005116 [Gossypium stocksii]
MVNHPKLDYGSQREFETGDHENKLKITEGVFDPINIKVDVEVVVVVDVEVTTNMKLQPILCKTVDEPIHFLAIVREMPTKEFNEFLSFSFHEEVKVWVNKALHDIKRKMLKIWCQMNHNVDVVTVKSKAISLESTKNFVSDTSIVEQTMDQNIENQLEVFLRR